MSTPSPTLPLNESVGESLFRDHLGRRTRAFRQLTPDNASTTEDGLFDPFAARTQAEMFTASGFKARYGLVLSGDTIKGYIGGESFLTDMVEEYYRHPSNPGRLKDNANFKCSQVDEQDLKMVLIGNEVAYVWVKNQYRSLIGKEPGNPPLPNPNPIPGPNPPPNPIPNPVPPTTPQPSPDPNPSDTELIHNLQTQVVNLKRIITLLSPSADIISTATLIKDWNETTALGSGKQARLRRLARYIEMIKGRIEEATK